VFLITSHQLPVDAEDELIVDHLDKVVDQVAEVPE
jgi:hypothetical protein